MKRGWGRRDWKKDKAQGMVTIFLIMSALYVFALWTQTLID